jgi:hypothetical protein
MVGRLSFNGNGVVQGNWTISFHNAAVPFGVRSHFETTGTYVVATDGHMFMEFEEFKIEPPASDDGVADGIVLRMLRREPAAGSTMHPEYTHLPGTRPGSGDGTRYDVRFAAETELGKL